MSTSPQFPSEESSYTLTFQTCKSRLPDLRKYLRRSSDWSRFLVDSEIASDSGLRKFSSSGSEIKLPGSSL